MSIAKIMIVEDEAIISKDIKYNLERMGYAVCAQAMSGEEAIEKVTESNPDLILMDIVLGGELDGIEAAEQIHDYQNIPVVYLTAFGDESKLERAKVTQPFGYLLKPFEDTHLYIAIEMALYRVKMDKEREKLISDLQAALAKIKTLSGIIPICAKCKKMRDDKGYWELVEVYVRDHTEAEFTHGLCPECAAEMEKEIDQMK